MSVADFAIVGRAWRHERHKFDLVEYPNVKRWYDMMFERSGVRRVFDVKLD